MVNTADSFANRFFLCGYTINEVREMNINHYEEWVKIGLNILYYRKEQRLTQEQLADLCGEDGMSRNYIQRIETGNSSCSVDTLIEIAKALNVPLYKLFEFK